MTDQRIRDHIDSLAQQLTLEEVIDTGGITRVVPTASARRTRSWAIAAALIAVLVLAGLAVIATRDTGSVASVSTEPVSTVTTVSTIGSVPPNVDPTAIGVEEPLVEIPNPGDQAFNSIGQEPTKPGSAHAFSVEGHPPVLLWTTVMLNLQGRVEEFQCVGEAGGSGCGPTSLPAAFGQTSSIDNGVATDDLFTWSNLPSDVATVRYDDGTKQLWQRPIAGLSIFRVNPDVPHPEITAYDVNGALLPYSFWGQNAPLSSATGPIDTTVALPPAVLGQAAGDLESLAQSSLRDCLTSNGATWTDPNVPNFADGVDAHAMWDSCVERIQSIVAARVAVLNSTTTVP